MAQQTVLTVGTEKCLTDKFTKEFKKIAEEGIFYTLTTRIMTKNDTIVIDQVQLVKDTQ